MITHCILQLKGEIFLPEKTDNHRNNSNDHLGWCGIQST